ncbi:hypothetical protein AYO44_13015 [Planctomycetaceae bacterium SCGC AG-212-F19]|nr:hypothetical protein AYO44_13015 [Planctomycetaceae bacterium SCGC AG-212-F19]
MRDIQGFIHCARAGRILLAVFAAVLLLNAALAQGQDGKIGTIDLLTGKGVEEVKGEWRYIDAFTGTGDKKNEIEPKAHNVFDDSKWMVLKPEECKTSRGAGNYCFGWYRIKVTIPGTVGGKDFKGGPVWFGTTVDDYGEIFVDGEIDLAPGKSGRGAITGFNTLNRVRLQKPDEQDKTKKRDAKPGDVFQIAVFGINSPLGVPPGNKVFLRPTTLDFYAAGAKDDGANVPKVAKGPEGKEAAVIDLLKSDGVKLVQGGWSRHVVAVHTGKNKNDIDPKASSQLKDDEWEKVGDPADLTKGFGPGGYSLIWYRTKVTIPEKVGDVNVAGSAVWFRTTVENYGEVWINGKVDSSFGSSGRGCVSGFNRENEIMLTNSAKPGDTFNVMVLAMNGPFGNPPTTQPKFAAPTQLRFFQK